MQCPRGFLIIRNMQSGELRPFFIKVREEDIIWKGDTEAEWADRVTPNYINGWMTETHSAFNRINMYANKGLPTLTRTSNKKATATFTLPYGARPDESFVHIDLISNGNQILEKSHVEARLINASSSTGLSTTLEVVLISPDGEYTDATISNLSGARLMIEVKGFTEDPTTYVNT